MKIDKIYADKNIFNDVNNVRRKEKKTSLPMNNEREAEKIANDGELKEITRICMDKSITKDVKIRSIIEVLQRDNPALKVLAHEQQEELMELLIEFFNRHPAGKNIFNSLIGKLRK